MIANVWTPVRRERFGNPTHEAARVFGILSTVSELGIHELRGLDDPGAVGQ